MNSSSNEPVSPQLDKAQPTPDPAKRVEELPEAADYRSDWNSDDENKPSRAPPSTREQPV
ncbi:MAG TPA: hypothetical protein VGN52_16190 [Burkholderiales bacterium]|jgi:hypothetical protein